MPTCLSKWMSCEKTVCVQSRQVAGQRKLTCRLTNNLSSAAPNLFTQQSSSAKTDARCLQIHERGLQMCGCGLKIRNTWLTNPRARLIYQENRHCDSNYFTVYVYICTQNLGLFCCRLYSRLLPIGPYAGPQQVCNDLKIL